jgi:hypothetical protein
MNIVLDLSLTELYGSRGDITRFKCPFDEDYNINALVDWTGSQTPLFESSAFPLKKVVPNIDKISAWKFYTFSSQELRAK